LGITPSNWFTLRQRAGNHLSRQGVSSKRRADLDTLHERPHRFNISWASERLRAAPPRACRLGHAQQNLLGHGNAQIVFMNSALRRLVSGQMPAMTGMLNSLMRSRKSPAGAGRRQAG